MSFTFFESWIVGYPLFLGNLKDQSPALGRFETIDSLHFTCDNGCVTQPETVTSNADAVSSDLGVIEVTHKRRFYFGMLGGQWKVFVDGTCAGVASLRKPASISVSPGMHTVKVWTRKGDGSSNLVELAVAPGSVRTLTCRVASIPFPIGFGLAGLRRQRALIGDAKQILRNGGVNTKYIELQEDS